MLLTKTMKILKEKNTQSTNNDSWIKKNQKHQLNIQGKEKTCEKNVVGNNSKLLLSGKSDFDPKEILDKSLLLDLNKN